MPRNSEPRIIDLEITDLCNAECSFCPRAKLTRPRGLMTRRTITALAAQLKKYCPPYVINFSGLGECLLHPQLASWIKTLKQKLRCSIGITTNGLALSPKKIAQLLTSKLDFLTISFNRNKKVRGNIQSLLALRRGRKPLVHIAYIGKTDRDKATLFNVTFIDQGIANVDGIILQPLHNRGGYLYQKRARKRPVTPCQIYKYSLFITWDGNVLSCCHDLAGKNVLGNINKEGLPRILNRRKEHLNKIDPFPGCSVCDDPRRSAYFAHGRFLSCRK
jgi:MoaA/NifB/PqqE/SkfB family radical SAM enzyme